MTEGFDDMIESLSADGEISPNIVAPGTSTAGAPEPAVFESSLPKTTRRRSAKATAHTDVATEVTPASDPEEYISDQTRAEMAAGARRIAQVAAEQARMRELEAKLEQSE